VTALDRCEGRPGGRDGYWPSSWPAECGGNRRQKAATGRLDAASSSASVVSRRDDRWNVMFVEREPGQWYLGGTMPAFSGPEPYGWVERLVFGQDGTSLETLEPEARSPRLPCGSHVWCGSILAHSNGAIYSVNGSYLHKLHSQDLVVLAERRLPVDRSHNGMLALRDGTIVTKDLRLEGQGGTTLTRLEPDSLELVGEPLVLPEGSMGRIAADLVEIDGVPTELVYVPGTEHVWRLVVADHLADGSFESGAGCGLEVDDRWRPRYRERNDRFGLSWDCCLSAGHCWIMDCGDIESVRAIHGTEPNGRFGAPPGRKLSWRRAAPWPGAQRLIRMSLTDDRDIDAIEPFGTPGGGIIAPPVHIPQVKPGVDMAIAWDSVNGGLAGIEFSSDRNGQTGGGDARAAGRLGRGGRGEMRVAWHLDVRPSMQPVVYPESGELVINDFHVSAAGGPPSDDLVVVDIATGALLDRVATGSRVANGMFLSAAGAGRVLYASTTAVALVTWS